MMTRKPTNIERIPDVEFQPKINSVCQVRRYKLITPLYGGGVDPNKSDPISIVRGTEVRGQLRFWWRAIRGAVPNGTINELLKREEAIWGSSGVKSKPGPSEVIIAVSIQTEGNKFQAVDFAGNPVPDVGDFRSIDSYVTFPLRNTNAFLLENVIFDLEIQYPTKYEDDVKAALWAWETFGGLGARTRRGLGAVDLVPIDGKEEGKPNYSGIKSVIEEVIKKYQPTAGSFPAGVPHINLSNFKVVTRRDPTKVMDIWRDVIRQYQSFRQSRPDPQIRRDPGRSHWPEPDMIRRHTGQHMEPRHRPIHPVRKFPRAKFGLPIIFEFKHDDRNAGDPEKTHLIGYGDIDRMASPLIIRPLLCKDGVAVVILILDWDSPGDESYTPKGGLRLVKKDQQGNIVTQWPVQSELTASEAEEIDPLDNQKEPNPLKAFLKSVK